MLPQKSTDYQKQTTAYLIQADFRYYYMAALGMFALLFIMVTQSGSFLPDPGAGSSGTGVAVWLFVVHQAFAILLIGRLPGVGPLVALPVVVLFVIFTAAATIHFIAGLAGLLVIKTVGLGVAAGTLFVIADIQLAKRNLMRGINRSLLFRLFTFWSVCIFIVSFVEGLRLLDLFFYLFAIFYLVSSLRAFWYSNQAVAGCNQIVDNSVSRRLLEGVAGGAVILAVFTCPLYQLWTLTLPRTSRKLDYGWLKLAPPVHDFINETLGIDKNAYYTDRELFNEYLDYLFNVDIKNEEVDFSGKKQDGSGE